MRRLMVVAAIAAATLTVAGCKKKKKDGEGTGAGPTASPTETANPSPTASPSPTTPDTTAGANKMKNCPNATPGATTVVADVEGGVKLTITAGDAAATTEIRERTKHLLASFKAGNTEVKHTGEGTGTGTSAGKCPLVLADATPESKDIEGGVEVTLKVADAAKLDEVRKRVKERNDAMGGKGGGDGSGTGGGTGGGGGGGQGAGTGGAK